MKLPNGDRAHVGTKLERYVLSPSHRDGRHKARVFGSSLGISTVNADVLLHALQVAAATSEAVATRGDNGYGEVFTLRLVVTTPKGAANVMSAWIIRYGEDFPRLTTCYIEETYG